MNINTVDLNLFLVFRAIYTTGSVTRAGDAVNMTQSAVSNALKRLRERFNDALFFRTPTGMVPTPLADELIGLVEEGLLKFTQAIDQAQRFEPNKSKRMFRMAINDIGQLVLMPGLLAAARIVAPMVRFETVGSSTEEETRNLLVDGKVDIAVGSWPSMGNGILEAKLCDETFVALMNKDHPFQGEQLSIDEYLAAEHIAYRPSGASDAALESTLHSHGVLARRNVVLTAAHSMGLESVVAASQLLLTVPSRLALAMVQARTDLRLVQLPFQVAPFPVRQQWHSRFDTDRANVWLRALVAEIFQTIPALVMNADVQRR